ncbi:hypothetical protein DFH29DRAFT_965620, partial [Suillus ampliporus]
AFVGFTSLNLSPSSSVPQASVGPTLHLHWQLLSYHVARPNLFLHFDVVFPTRDIEYRRNSPCGVQRTPLCDADLDKPAADELTMMTINFQRNPFEWDINVKRDEGIRVRDVFEAIYAAFDVPLTPYEKSLIPLRLHAGCEEAFRLRCNLAPVLPIVEKRQGWKRVDTLLHESIFCGLTQSKSGDWTLNLSGMMLRAKQDSDIMDKGRLWSNPTALRYWLDLILTTPIAHHWWKDLMRDALVPDIEITAPNSSPSLPDSLVEYLPPYPDQTLNALSKWSLFNLPFLSRSACRICNFARLSAILQHGRLCNLLDNIPPLIPNISQSIPKSSTQDYTWAFFCRSVPLDALFDSPSRGPLPIVQPDSDRARLIERLEADLENPRNTMSWLHGPSGTGKSVIAYSLASRCKQKRGLAGNFFFSRRQANCRSARCVVLALAINSAFLNRRRRRK